MGTRGAGLARIAVLVVGLGVGSATALADPLAGLVLEDSARARWSLDDLAHRPVLVAFADRRGSRDAFAWGAAIGKARPELLRPWAAPDGLPLVAIATPVRVPPMIRGPYRLVMRAMLAGRAPEGGPQLLVDWDALLVARLRVPVAGATVVLLDAAHVEVARVGGPLDAARLSGLLEVIDQIVALRRPDR